MTDVVSAARTARENLARGLGALQSPGVPEYLLAAAEPIAKAMSNLHQIEATQGQSIAQSAPLALSAVREALSVLQSAPSSHPAVDAALEAVAGSLGVVHQLTQITGSGRPLAMPQSPMAFAATAQAPAGNPVYAAPPATAPVPTAQAYQPPPTAPVFAPMGQPHAGPANGAMPHANPLADTRQSAGAVPPGPASAFVPSSTLPSQGNSPLAAGVGTGAAAPVVFGSAPTQPEAAALAPPTGPRIEAALGAHSPTNFYKGLSGNDVVDAGGIFVATYQIPRMGANIALHVSLPGGYEFQAQAVVRWTREPSSVADGSSPGFGAQFTSISQEGRQLVYRYVRNREPIFHDDF